MNFIDVTVKPVIEARFLIDRTRQTLLGHSFGGLFTLETLFDRPRSFQAYVALSPAIWWNNRAALRQAQAFLAKPDRPAKLRVFLSVDDLDQHRTQIYVATSITTAGRSRSQARRMRKPTRKWLQDMQPWTEG